MKGFTSELQQASRMDWVSGYILLVGWKELRGLRRWLCVCVYAGIGKGGVYVYIRNLNHRVERRRKHVLLEERGFESMRDRRT